MEIQRGGGRKAYDFDSVESKAKNTAQAIGTLYYYATRNNCNNIFMFFGFFVGYCFLFCFYRISRIVKRMLWRLTMKSVSLSHLAMSIRNQLFFDEHP